MGNCIFGKCQRGLRPSEVCKDLEKDFNLLYKRSESLEIYLKELDDMRKVDCRIHRTITEQAEEYVAHILNHVEQQDMRFKSTFLRSGSFYDETKVGFPDEYDFMAKLELLSKPGLGKAVSTKLGFVQVVLEDQESIELWKEFLAKETGDNGEVIYVLSIMMISQRFSKLVDMAMKLVALPDAWQRHPCSLFHGPCAMLKFVVDGSQTETSLRISIDLAPCISYPNYKSVQFPFYKYLKDKSSSTSFLHEVLATGQDVLLVPFTLDSVQRTHVDPGSWLYNYRNQMRVSFSMLEKAIFRQFASNSTEKRLLRVLKIIRDIHLKDEGSIEEWEEPLPEGVFPDEPPSTLVQVASVEPISSIYTGDQAGDQERAQTSSDLANSHEYFYDNDVRRDLLQTYIFKSLFFYAKLYQDDWFSEGLSRPALECPKALLHIYSTPHSTVPNFFFDGYTGQTPNERNREKILRRLRKIVAYLKLQTALQ